MTTSSMDRTPVLRGPHSPSAADALSGTPATWGAAACRRAPFFLASLFAVFLLGFLRPATAESRPVRVAVVTDGPAGRELLPLATIEKELPNVAPPEFRLDFPPDKRFAGDWSLQGASRALARALDDPDVDVVLTLGVLASHEAAQLTQLPKPVIAPMVIDPVLQRYPRLDGKSGRHNFGYVERPVSVEQQVRAFHAVAPFKHLAVLADGAVLSALPQLNEKTAELAAALGVDVTIVSARADAAGTLAALPKDTDAVYVAAVQGLAPAELHAFADGLVARRLPSFSMLGRADLEAGLLLSTTDAERDGARLARRLVTLIERASRGDDLADAEVAFAAEQRLVINMRVAKAMGYSPKWQFLADAQLLNADGPGQLPAVSLSEAMAAALEANLSLAASRARTQSGADDVAIARSNLLPSLSATATRTRIDADHASPLTQAENSTTLGLSAQQLVFSDSAWAGYSIARSQLASAIQATRRDTLDTLESTASAYLDALRAKSAEAVRRANVENTRKNLEISRARESIGLGGHSDYLRWVAQLARDKQALLGAEATRGQAELELARIMQRPTSQPFATVESGLDDPLQVIASARTQALLDNPARWEVFGQFVVRSALEQSPEILQSEAQVAARTRALTAARRAFYLPDVALVSKSSSVTQQSGAGAAVVPGAPDDRSWSLSLQAGLPVFAGGLHRAKLSQARHELQASEADRGNARAAIEARARAALVRAGSSYPSIELSRQAAAAADENLAMVTDAYARGAVSVTDLIDAQDAALSADLGATDARYGFLDDFVGLLRVLGQFDILLDPAAREAWLRRVDDYVLVQGGTR